MWIEIACVVALMALAWLLLRRDSALEHVKSDADGQTYLVRNLPDKVRAANLLAELNGRIESLIAYLASTYPGDPDYKRLQNNYRPQNIREGGVKPGLTSYTENKRTITLCLRQAGTDEFVDTDVLMYVALHELAHVASVEIGHQRSFWALFTRILDEARKIGVYRPVDYAQNPARFCGITIDSSVLSGTI